MGAEAHVSVAGGPIFPGRLGIVQRVMAPYRLPLLDLLATRCAGGLSAFAGHAPTWEPLPTRYELAEASLALAHNRHLLRGSFYLCWQDGQRRWLERWQPDILIMEANPRLVSAPLAARWMHRHGRPVLGWGWGLGTATHAPHMVAARRWARVPFLHQFDGMLAYSTQAAAQYTGIGLPEDRVFVAKNAVTHAPSTPPPERSSSFVQQPIVLFVGRLVPAKRLGVLLRACALLAAERFEPRPALRIVGDGPERESLQALASDIYPDTAFVGWREGPELVGELERADVFAIPGQAGLAVQEAMSRALPIVVADGDGTQYDLVREKNGWHVTPGDAQSMASSLRDALSDPARLRLMGAASYQIVRDEVNIDRLVESMVTALNRISNVGPQPSAAARRPDSRASSFC